MTLAEYVDGLAKAGTIDGNIAERIMGLHRKESNVPCAAIRDALMPIVAEMDEYHARCTIDVQCAHDKFWDTHEPQTIGDFSDRITDAVANLCGEIATNEVRERYKKARPVRVLEEPPRNCDVGTAEEQHERFMKFCVHVHKSVCGDCPLIGGRSLCQLQWAQMPYQQEGGAVCPSVTK